MVERSQTVNQLLQQRRGERETRSGDEADRKRRTSRIVNSLIELYAESDEVMDDCDVRLTILGSRQDKTAVERRAKLENKVLEAYRDQRRVVAELEQTLQYIDAPSFKVAVVDATLKLEKLPRHIRLNMIGYEEVFEGGATDVQFEVPVREFDPMASQNSEDVNPVLSEMRAPFSGRQKMTENGVPIAPKEVPESKASSAPTPSANRLDQLLTDSDRVRAGTKATNQAQVEQEIEETTANTDGSAPEVTELTAVENAKAEGFVEVNTSAVGDDVSDEVIQQLLNASGDETGSSE